MEQREGGLLLRFRYVVVHDHRCPLRHIWCTDRWHGEQHMAPSGWSGRRFGVTPPTTCTCSPDAWIFTVSHQFPLLNLDTLLIKGFDDLQPPTTPPEAERQARFLYALFQRWKTFEIRESDRLGTGWCQGKAFIPTDPHTSSLHPYRRGVLFVELKDGPIDTVDSSSLRSFLPAEY
jgi:hypothetical protein